MKIGNKKNLLWSVAILACAVSFAAGWFIEKDVDAPAIPLPLRLSGYQYISPLLSCNLNGGKLFPPSQSLDNAIQSVVDTHQNDNDITDASVYFTDFTTGKWATVNGDEKYYPASLGKVPIMMALYAMQEASDTTFDQEASYPVGLPDLNAQQEITPPDAIIPGRDYSVNDLIGYMIKYSDNNAADVLASLANQNVLQDVYSNLQIPLTNGQLTSSTIDVMTPEQYSIVFRTLYNSTYLSHEDSEAALELMTHTTFTQGIVAGVPSSTVVSHKFGNLSVTQGGVTTGRELHDCGIVYAPSHPYLLCVMTRGTSSLAGMESTIADISRTVYSKVENGNE